ncbi:hypothetical protein [Arthrobacter sp. ISL-28]|uniref:hypothetical protein n=1 Tax=Arthrobacter sp. ISL-28 TaxID=2819108 RepID=UPI0020352339|nr:hypothetical protein [Arthrobacter sp. ISL-28]
MGIGDSIGKAAENAMEDLAGTSKPTDDAHVPEPGTRDDDVQVHSSISEGSNAMDNDGGPGTSGAASGSPETPGPETGGSEARGSDTAGSETGAADTAGPDTGSAEAGGTTDSGGIGAAEGSDLPRDVAGSAGLPDPDPDELRADPSEGDQDPTTGLGRS